MTAIKHYVIDLISTSASKITPVQLEKQLSDQFNISRTVSRKYISDLVQEGELAYTYLFGSSFLEKSFNRPVYITESIVLLPTGSQKKRLSGTIEIELMPGASFGTGRHPSTRLAVRSIERLLTSNRFNKSAGDAKALDIGTGSGILAMVLVLLGIKQATGTDIESCARKEARENIDRNGLADRITVSRQETEEIEGRFSLVTANLRYPTLMTLQPHIRRLTTAESAVVLSGIKTDEAAHICDAYSAGGFQHMWQLEEAGWECVVFNRT